MYKFLIRHFTAENMQNTPKEYIEPIFMFISRMCHECICLRRTAAMVEHNLK